MAKPEFISMARAALNHTKKKSTWEVFLRGYASTNQRGSATERDILEGLWKNFPTVDALRNACPMDELPAKDRDNPKLGSGLQNLRDRRKKAKSLCKVPQVWDELSYLLRCPDEDSQARVRNFSLDARGGNPNKRIANMEIGLATKGADMTLLWGGCEVPVIDLWMLRYLTPQVPQLGGQSWRQLIQGTLKVMRERGEKLNLKTPGQPAEADNFVQPEDIDENNELHIVGGSGYVQGWIQSKPQYYQMYRDAAYRQAEKEGLPANVWHVATWIELIQSQKYDKDGNKLRFTRDDYDVWLNNPGDTDVKADKQAVRKSRDFLNTLRLPLPEPYGPASHVDMSMITFNVPDEFHDEIEGGDPRKTPRKPNTWDERINFDIGGIEIYLDYDTYNKEFDLDISRESGEPSVQDFKRVKELVYALLRENPGSAFQIRAMGSQRRNVYERVGFEVIKASQLRSGVMYQMRLAGVPSAYRDEEPGTEWPEGSDEWVKEQARTIVGAYMSGSITGNEAGNRIIGLKSMVRKRDMAQAKAEGTPFGLSVLYEQLERTGDQMQGGYIDDAKPEAYGGEEPDSPEWFKEQISLVMRGQTGQTLSTEAALDMLRQMRSEVTGLLRFKPGVGEDVEQYPTIKATAERRSWEFVVELIDQHIDSLEAFGEPSHKFDPDREPTEAQKRYYQRGKYPHESWLREPQDSGEEKPRWQQIAEKVLERPRWTRKQIAEHFGVSVPLVDKSLQEARYRGYEGITKERADRRGHTRAKEYAEWMVDNPGATQIDAGQHFGVSQAVISAALIKMRRIDPTLTRRLGEYPYREEEPNHSFMDLSGLSRYAADIEALVS